MVQKERRVPLNFQQRASKHLSYLKENDVIEGPLDSSASHKWISNVVITEKKNKEKIRMTVDMRHANMAIKPTHFPVPTIQELQHKLNGATKFSKIDLTEAFHQMELGKESRELTTFYRHEGLYRFKRLVQGAGPASQEFHEKFRLCLQGLKGVVQIHDDVIVYGTSDEDHLANLRGLFDRLLELGVTLSKAKCAFDLDEVAFFGFVFNKYGMKPDPKKVQAIHTKAIPKSITKVKSFLQMCQYNQMFLFDTHKQGCK